MYVGIEIHSKLKSQISHLAMIPDLAKIPSDRTELTAIRYTMTNLSTIFVYLVGEF